MCICSNCGKKELGYATDISSSESEHATLLCFNCVEAFQGKHTVTCIKCRFTFDPKEVDAPDNADLCVYCAKECVECKRNFAFKIQSSKCVSCSTNRPPGYPQDYVMCPNGCGNYMQADDFMCNQCLNYDVRYKTKD
jgi:hypothetical protein